jgi:hypothetical protein
LEENDAWRRRDLMCYHGQMEDGVPEMAGCSGLHQRPLQLAITLAADEVAIHGVSNSFHCWKL